MTEYLDSLNGEQREAVLTTEGHVRVIAGAGTGKTRALTARYCYLVDTAGIAPRNILCATFTNRAADVMKQRIRKMLGDLDLGMICTFHAFCVQLLREDINVLNYPKEFVIMDQEDVKDTLLKVFADMGLNSRDITVKKANDEILEARKMRTENYIDDVYLLNNEELKAKFEATKDMEDGIFLRYLYEQKKSFGLDFNDLINFATYILERFPDVRAKWADRMEYVMVDEFQDVSAKQYNIAKILSSVHNNLFIVGDPDQTIYTWRGSHAKMFLDFDKEFPDAKTVVLDINYRSVPEILTASDELISHNIVRYPKNLKAVKEEGTKPVFFHAKNDREEAQWICARIMELRKEGGKLGDCAILYRAHHLSRPLEEALMKNKIPYVIFGGTEFYARREVKDLICYLRMVAYGDDIAFRRVINVPPRKIGRKKMAVLEEARETRGESLYEALKENLMNPLFRGTDASTFVKCIESARELRGSLSLGDLLQTVMDRSGYERFLRLQGDQERLDNVAELKRGITEYGEDPDATLEDFLVHVSLFDGEGERNKDRVKLMTVHTSKGMEFPYVFICGLDEGVFPSKKTDSPEDMEEERRLMYVAMTRAEYGLYLTDSEGPAESGGFKTPSRFVFEIGRGNLDYAVELDPDMMKRMEERTRIEEARVRRMSDLYRKGDRVVHPVFGNGTIVEVSEREMCYVVRFDKLATERTIRFDAKMSREL